MEDRLSGEKVCDVLIAGGGPAGTSTAIALAHRGLTSVILERSSYDGFRIGESLPPSAQGLLRALGVWERFLQDGHRPSLYNAAAWGGPDLQIREHLFHPYGQGWHLDRSRFDAMLAGAAREAGARVLEGFCVQTVARTGDVWHLTVRGRDRSLCLRGAWLIDAGGRAASLTRKLGGRRRASDRLVGVTAFLAPEAGAAALEPSVLVEAEEEGWWYSAPLPDGRAVAAFMTDAGLPGYASIHSPAVWWNRLCAMRYTRERLHGYRPPASLTVRPAAPAVAKTPGLPRFLPVGDAAVSFDPLSSMGISEALRGGLEAAEAIADEREGSPGTLAGAAARPYRLFQDHLGRREGHYRMEGRWSDAPFWRLRSGSMERRVEE